MHYEAIEELSNAEVESLYDSVFGHEWESGSNFVAACYSTCVESCGYTHSACGGVISYGGYHSYGSCVRFSCGCSYGWYCG